MGFLMMVIVLGFVVIVLLVVGDAVADRRCSS